MPHFWGNILVVTKDELVLKYYNTYDGLKKSVQRYSKLPYGIKKVQSGGNGRQLLINFDTLPKEMQDSIGDPRKMNHPLLNFWEINSSATAFYTSFEFPDGTPLKMEYQEEYITNASVLIALQRLREYRLAMKKNKIGIMESLRIDMLSFNDILPKIHTHRHTMDWGERHFSRAFKEFLNAAAGDFNFGSLISKKLNNQHAKIMTEEMEKVLNNMFAGREHKPTKTQVAEEYNAFLNGEVDIINDETGEIYDSTDRKKFKPLSESSIIAWLGKWENIIGTYAKRSGNRQELISQFIPHHSLDQVKEAGIMVSIDDRQPPFHYEGNKRLWAYMGIDLGAEVWTSWVFGKDKDENLMLEFYRQMVRNYTEWGFNLPLELECESHLNSLFRDNLLQNGAMFDRVRMEANNARGKKVERYFGKLRYEFEKDKNGWLARPTAKRESNQQGAGEIPKIPIKEIEQNCLYDIQIWNNMEHRTHKGKTRWEVFCEMQSEKTKPTNWRAILPHLGFSTRTSCRAGIVKFRKSEYLLGLDNEICTGDDLIRLMKYIEGKSFEVYWLDGNDDEVLKAMVYYDDMMLCELLPKPTYSRAYHERNDTDKINRQIMSAYENTINTFMKIRKNEIDNLTIIDRRQKTLNSKFQIAGLEGFKPREEPAKVIEIEPSEPMATNERRTGRLSKSIYSNFR